MVDSENRLCLASNPEKCARCTGFPVSRTFLRESYIQKSFEYIDCFVAPSEFARLRYLTWGLEASKIRVIPNPIELKMIAEKRRQFETGTLRIVYIGQHTPYKGLEVLLAGLQIIKDSHPNLVTATIYGAGAELFGVDFANRLERAIGVLGDSCVRGGSYQQSELPSILDEADVVVVPSTWWENSPVVIEEALSRRIPIVCSDIGGMAEKVRDKFDGYHFSTGNPQALAAILMKLANHPELLNLAHMRRPISMTEVALQHLEIYGGFMSM